MQPRRQGAPHAGDDVCRSMAAQLPSPLFVAPPSRRRRYRQPAGRPRSPLRDSVSLRLHDDHRGARPFPTRPSRRPTTAPNPPPLTPQSGRMAASRPRWPQWHPRDAALGLALSPSGGTLAGEADDAPAPARPARPRPASAVRAPYPGYVPHDAETLRGERLLAQTAQPPTAPAGGRAASPRWADPAAEPLGRPRSAAAAPDRRPAAAEYDNVLAAAERAARRQARAAARAHAAAAAAAASTAKAVAAAAAALTPAAAALPPDRSAGSARCPARYAPGLAGEPRAPWAHGGGLAAARARRSPPAAQASGFFDETISASEITHF